MRPERRSWIAFAALLALAGLTQWLLWLFVSDPTPAEFVGPLRPDYSLDEFELRVYKDNGQLSFTVEAPHMDRHGGDGHFVVSTPQMLILREGEPKWQAQSQQSVIDAGGNQLELIGGVIFESLPDDPRPIDIRTDYLLAYPETQQVSTPSPVTVLQGQSILRGSALRADFLASRMELDDFNLQAPPSR